MTIKSDRSSLLKLSLATLLSALATSCAASNPDDVVVQPVAVQSTLAPAKNTPQEAEPKVASNGVPVQSATAAGEDAVAIENHSDVTTATEVGEDAFAVEEVAQSVASDIAATPLDIYIGMPYAEARAQIIRQGWIPNNGPEPASGVERTLYNRGYREVDACAGTGLGPCVFYFFHPDRTGPNEEKDLRVRTNGGASQTQISGWETYHYDSNAVTSAVTSEVVSEIPAQFHGEWNVNGSECGPIRGDGQLSLSADRISFYESSGPVTEVVAQGESKITVYSSLSSEGTTFTDITTFELSDYGSVLSDVDGDRRWRRCPG